MPFGGGTLDAGVAQFTRGLGSNRGIRRPRRRVDRRGRCGPPLSRVPGHAPALPSRGSPDGREPRPANRR